MAKDKLSVNPALAHHKREKAKLLRKGKAEAVARRDERLARRNPEQIRRQMEKLKPHETERLEELKKELQLVEKARKTMGKETDGEALGKRRREDGDHDRDHQRQPTRRRVQNRHDEISSGSASDTDESVRNIPMPRDTPPPVPREYWQARRNKQEQRNAARGGRDGAKDTTKETGEDPEAEAEAESEPKPEPEKRLPAQTVFESRPQIRDIQREVVQAFTPAAVARQQKRQKQQVAGTDREDSVKKEQQAHVEDVNEDEEDAEEESSAV